MSEPMHLDVPEGVVALAGDWGGRTSQVTPKLMSLGDRGISYVLHAGDLGLWPGPIGKRYLRDIDRVCSKFGIEQILVTPGNHEDWDRLDTLWAQPKRKREDGSPLPVAVSDHVTFLPRAWRWTMASPSTTRSFVSLGGAPSLDFESLTEGVSWWPGEAIQPEDVQRTVAEGHAEVMICHDAPGIPWATPPVVRILETNPHAFSAAALEYARIGRERVTEAFLGVAPRILGHGHYHCGGQATFRLPGRDYDTTVWSLADQSSASNLRLLDLDTLTDPPGMARG